VEGHDKKDVWPLPHLQIRCGANGTDADKCAILHRTIKVWVLISLSLCLTLAFANVMP